MACLGITIWYSTNVRISDRLSFVQVALDYIPKNDLYWVGNCNELNAGTAMA